MLTLKIIRDQTEMVCKRLAVKRFDAAGIVQTILSLDDKRRSLQTATDGALAEQKGLAKQIGKLMQLGKYEEAEAVKMSALAGKELVKTWETELQIVSHQLHETMLLLPNLPSEFVPEGKGEDQNMVVREDRSLCKLEESLPHWEVALKYHLIDFDGGVKIAGAGFPVYKGRGARLQRAIISYCLDFNTSAGYLEVQPPLMVNETSAYGTGQLPDKEGQMYGVDADHFFMIPTSEVPVTNLYRDVIVEPKELPVKMTAYTPCFRREAGSYGKDVRGLNRLHQFDKVEIVQIQRPEESYRALDEMVAHVEQLVKSLHLPYRIVRLCGGDLSFASALTYDFEVWSAGQERWLEVSSVSNFESFQANRLKLRYRDEQQKIQLLHTLNGSALALPRIVAALLENHYTPHGVVIPEVLRPYTHFDLID